MHVTLASPPPSDHLPSRFILTKLFHIDIRRRLEWKKSFPYYGYIANIPPASGNAFLD